MSKTLPPELLDLIIRELHTHVPSLRACALSFRAMVPFAQTHLFYKVVLGHAENLLEDGEPERTPCQKLSRLLDTSPHLASLVKDLRIVDDDPYLTSWVENEARTLARILPLFNLKRISIRCKTACLDWDKMRRELKASLLEIFASPRLEAVQLHGVLISAPTECPLFHIFMHSQHNLQHLSFSYHIRRQWHRDRSLFIPPVWAPKLRSLVIDTNYVIDLLHGLSSPAMDYSRLRTLTLSGFNDSEINELLYAMKGRNMLEHLTILESARVNLDGLQFLTNLRTLHFRAFDLLELAAIVKHCTKNALLEKIVLQLCVYNAVNYAISSWTALAVATKDSGKTVEVALGEYGVKDPRPWRLQFCFNLCVEWARVALSISPGLTMKNSNSYVPLADIYDGW